MNMESSLSVQRLRLPVPGLFLGESLSDLVVFCFFGGVNVRGVGVGEIVGGLSDTSDDDRFTSTGICKMTSAWKDAQSATYLSNLRPGVVMAGAER